MKKIFTLLTLVLTSTFIFAQSGYFTGDGGKGKSILVDDSVMVNGKADKSDEWICLTIKNNLMNDLITYSNIEITNSTEKRNLLNHQKESNSILYDENSSIAVGNLIFAKSYISITTTGMQENGNTKYNLSASIYNLETGKAEGGYTSKIFYSENEYLSLAHGEVAAELLAQLGVKLTDAGKRLINPVSVNGVILDYQKSLSQSKENLNAIDSEIKKLEAELAKLSSNQSKTKEDLAAQAKKETQAALLKQQQVNERQRIERIQKDEENRRKEEKLKKERDSELQKKIDLLSSQIQKKAAEIKSQQTSDSFEVTYVERKIQNLESEKETYAVNKTSVDNSIAEFEEKNKEECRVALRNRKRQKPRRGEVDAAGNLTEVGKRVLNNDLKKIHEKYNLQLEEYKSSLFGNTQDAQVQLMQKIREDIKELENEKYSASTLSEKGLYLRVGEFDGTTGKEGWVYTLDLNLFGKTFISIKDTLLYKEITGKDPVIFPEDDDPDFDEKYIAYYEYLDELDSFDSFFRMNIPYVSVDVDYSLKAKPYNELSSYELTINKITYKNLQNGNIFRETTAATKGNVKYIPAVLVDWRSDEDIAAEKVRLQQERDVLNKKFGISMTPVDSASFTMGNSDSDKDYMKHTVKLSSYEISKERVSAKLYEQVMGKDPSNSNNHKITDCVDSISWTDAIKFCNKLSQLSGLSPCYSINESYPYSSTVNLKANGYRLATEAEWEYAAGQNIIDALATGQEWVTDTYGSFSSLGEVNPVKQISSTSKVLRGKSVYKRYGVHYSYTRGDYLYTFRLARSTIE